MQCNSTYQNIIIVHWNTGNYVEIWIWNVIQKQLKRLNKIDSDKQYKYEQSVKLCQTTQE